MILYDIILIKFNMQMFVSTALSRPERSVWEPSRFRNLVSFYYTSPVFKNLPDFMTRHIHRKTNLKRR